MAVIKVKEIEKTFFTNTKMIYITKVEAKQTQNSNFYTCLKEHLLIMASFIFSAHPYLNDDGLNNIRAYCCIEIYHLFQKQC